MSSAVRRAGGRRVGGGRRARAALLAGAVVASACGGSSAANDDTATSGPAPTIESYVDATAAGWGVALTPPERTCLVDTLVAELGSAPDAEIDESWLADAAPIRVPFYFVSCGVDVTAVAGTAADPAPLDVIVGALLTDENVLPSLDEIDCVKTGLLDRFGSSGLIALLGGSAEPSAGDDAMATEVFDACGLDGDDIVGG